MAQQDIAPMLLELLQKDFLDLLGDAAFSGSSYADAEDYAEAVGTALAEAFRRNLTADTLPDGKLYWNIADRVVRPMLEQDHTLVADAAAMVQQRLNEQSGLALKAQRAMLDESRVDGILQKAAAAENFEEAAWVLDEPVRTFSRMTVDDTLKANVDFQGGAGLTPRVIRTAESGCCKWCSAQAGTYTYPDVPQDVYRRHERCRCRVEYDPGRGRRQNVWNKQWTEGGEQRQERIAFAETPLKSQSSIPKESPAENVLPEYLRTATPGVGTVTYDEGYDLTRHAEEIKAAQWLHDHLGGDIVLLNEANTDKQKTPDYLWRDSLWDLKTVTSEKAANSAVRHGLAQIVGNPGGIILNFEERNFSPSELWRVIDKRLSWYNTDGKIDILVLSHGELVAVKRY